METAHPTITEVRVLKVDATGASREVDDVAAREEPLEIRVEGRSVAVVMRTPGHDEELAAGFLVSEGVVKHPRDILEVSQCPSINNKHGNVVDVLLGGAVVNWDSLTRHVFSASSCGLCGKTSIESVFGQFPPVTAEWSVSPKLIASLPDKLRATQETFSKTGGLHACAVFDLDRRAAQRRRQSARGQLRAYRRTRAESRDYGRSKAIVIADVVGGDLYVYEPSPRRCDRRCTQRLPTVESFIQFLFLRPVFLFAAITGQVMWNSITVT